jgi:hypothetical protein
LKDERTGSIRADEAVDGPAEFERRAGAIDAEDAVESVVGEVVDRDVAAEQDGERRPVLDGEVVAGDDLERIAGDAEVEHGGRSRDIQVLAAGAGCETECFRAAAGLQRDGARGDGECLNHTRVGGEGDIVDLGEIERGAIVDAGHGAVRPIGSGAPGAAGIIVPDVVGG